MIALTTDGGFYVFKKMQKKEQEAMKPGSDCVDDGEDYEDDEDNEPV